MEKTPLEPARGHIIVGFRRCKQLFVLTPMSADYTAVQGLMALLRALNNEAAEGTGISHIIKQGKNLIGETLPPVLINYNISVQNALFGGYPSSWDIVPAAIFAAIFGVILVIHSTIFAINMSRCHFFWVSLTWIFYCVLKVIGYILRVVWAKDVTQINIGLCGEVFQIVPAYILVSFNLILAQRLFTWRHPVGGSRMLFWNFMFGMYGMVMVFVGVIITASFAPYLAFLSEKAYWRWATVVKATSIVVILYVLTTIILIALSYVFQPTKKDENLYTYQPWWIESFSPFYFVQKGAAASAEMSFMRRNHNHRHAVRVIAATHHHFNVVKGLTNERGDLKHNWSIILLSASTLCILVGAIARCVVTFQFQQSRYSGLIGKPILGYIFWGALEALVNLMYIVGRFDLRFYRPDILPAVVRAIITAEQSYYPSESEDEGEDEGEDEDDTVSKAYTSASAGSYDRNEPPYPTDEYGSHPFDDTGFKFPDEKGAIHHKDDEDDESVFHF